MTDRYDQQMMALLGDNASLTPVADGSGSVGGEAGSKQRR